MVAAADTAIYVHIPFCRTRCAYCDFNTYVGLEALLPAYVEALCAEIAAAPAVRAGTLYFGGGTPSLLRPEQAGAVLETARPALGLPPDVEVTLEANPGTVDGEKLRHLRRLGVSRLSLGVQSARDDELRLLGRRHRWADVLQAVQAARTAGFDNLNLDLIYGLPGQRLEQWQHTLQAALALAPEHLSLYALTVEPKTALAARIAAGELPPPDEDHAAAMYEWSQRALAAAGFLQYEISNWARDSSFVCRHNLTYWRNEPYLGFGAGAASWWGGRRWSNTSHPAAYIEQVGEGGSAVDDEEAISRPLEMGETMMMGLRLVEGVSEERFRSRFGQGLVDVFGAELRLLSGLGLLEWDGRAARLTPRGRLLGNQVFQHFLPG